MQRSYTVAETCSDGESTESPSAPCQNEARYTSISRSGSPRRVCGAHVGGDVAISDDRVPSLLDAIDELLVLLDFNHVACGRQLRDGIRGMIGRSR